MLKKTPFNILILTIWEAKIYNLSYYSSRLLIIYRLLITFVLFNHHGFSNR